MGSLSDEKKKKYILDIVYLSAVILLIWFCFTYLLPVIAPFLVGYVIAALMQPCVSFMHHRLKMDRKASGVIAVLIFVILFTVAVSFGLSRLFSELSAVFGMLPRFISTFGKAFEGITEKISGMMNQLPIDIAQKLSNTFENVSTEFTKMSSVTSGLTSVAVGTAAQVPGILLATIITVVSACFISSDYPEIRGFFLRQLPEKYQNWAMDIKEFFFITLARLIRAYLTLMLITFAELCIWLTLLGIPHSVMIAALIALVDILPVLGTGTVVIPWALIELVIGNWHLCLLLVAMYASITIIRNILEPKIVGYHIGLYPLVTLISMYVGLKTFGAAGMFLFPILVIIVKHMHDAGKIKIWKD